MAAGLGDAHRPASRFQLRHDADNAARHHAPAGRKPVPTRARPGRVPNGLFAIIDAALGGLQHRLGGQMRVLHCHPRIGI